MRRAADACTTLRIALAPLFVWVVLDAHGQPSPLPLVVYLVAAVSDFIDGRLARASGTASVRGRLFDHVADAIFLFPTLFVLAALERVPFLLPCAAALAFSLYALEGWQRGARPGTIALLSSQVGAVGGVLNYVVAGVAAAALALGPTALDGPLYVAALLTGVANLGAAAGRLPGTSRPIGSVRRTLTSRIGRS